MDAETMIKGVQHGNTDGAGEFVYDIHIDAA
jgi:hypothetical protein